MRPNTSALLLIHVMMATIASFFYSGEILHKLKYYLCKIIGERRRDENERRYKDPSAALLFFLTEVVWWFRDGNSDDDCQNAGGRKKPFFFNNLLVFSFELRFSDKLERIKTFY